MWAIYSDVSSGVRSNDKFSKNFTVNFGFRKVSVSVPLLLSIFMLAYGYYMLMIWQSRLPFLDAFV